MRPPSHTLLAVPRLPSLLGCQLGAQHTCSAVKIDSWPSLLNLQRNQVTGEFTICSHKAPFVRRLCCRQSDQAQKLKIWESPHARRHDVYTTAGSAGMFCFQDSFYCKSQTTTTVFHSVAKLQVCCLLLRKANTQDAGVDVKESGLFSGSTTWKMGDSHLKAHLSGGRGFYKEGKGNRTKRSRRGLKSSLHADEQSPFQ